MIYFFFSKTLQTIRFLPLQTHRMESFVAFSFTRYFTHPSFDTEARQNYLYCTHLEILCTVAPTRGRIFPTKYPMRRYSHLRSPPKPVDQCETSNHPAGGGVCRPGEGRSLRNVFTPPTGVHARTYNYTTAHTHARTHTTLHARQKKEKLRTVVYFSEKTSVAGPFFLGFRGCLIVGCQIV